MATYLAEWRLAQALTRHGARVLIVRLPAEPDGEKNGLDDYLIRHGSSQLRRLLADATEPTDPTEPNPVNGEPTEQAQALAAALATRQLLRPTGRCKAPVPVVGHRRSSGRRCVAAFGCGNGRECMYCRKSGLYIRYLKSEAYILRVTAPDCPEPDRRQLAYAARPDPIREAGRKAIRRAVGEYMDTETAAPEVFLPDLAPPTKATAGAKSDSTPGHVILVALPVGATIPNGYNPITPAEALQIIGDAFTTVAKPPPDRERYRPVRTSHGWGDEPHEEPGDFDAEGTAAFTVEQTREIVRSLNIEAPAGRIRQAQTQPVGWSAGGPARDLAMSLILSRRKGDATKHTPAEAIHAAGQWIRWLPADLGDGPNVRELLAKNLWSGPSPYLVTLDEVRAAHERDESERRWRHEATALIVAVRAQYRESPASLPALIREVMAATEPKMMTAEECVRRLALLRAAPEDKPDEQRQHQTAV